MSTIRSTFQKSRSVFAQNEAEWGISPTTALVIALAPVALIGCLVVIAGLSFVNHDVFRPMFRWITAEDSILEWSQFLFVFLSSLICGAISIRLARMKQYPLAALYALLALAALFVAGEEISWGQRVFGWETPEALDAINHQGETNVHNIRWVQRLFGFAVLIGGMYGTITPLLSLKYPGKQPRTLTHFMLVPPLFSVTSFLMPFAYRAFRILIWPGTDFMVVKIGKGPELCLYFGLLVFTALNLWRLRQTAQQPIAQVATV